MTLRYVYALAALLTAIGLSIFVYKWQVLGFPVTDNQKTPIWMIETAIRFDSGPGSIKANMQIPTLTPGFRMLREYNVSKGYGFSLNNVSGGRKLHRFGRGKFLRIISAQKLILSLRSKKYFRRSRNVSIWRQYAKPKNLDAWLLYITNDFRHCRESATNAMRLRFFFERSVTLVVS